MKAEHHTAITVPVSLIIFYYTHSIFYFLLSLFLGIFVDMDHVFDYIREEKRFDFKDMFIKSYKGDFKKLYIIFHAYEYVLIVWLVALYSKQYEFAIIFTISYLLHLLPDQFFNNARPFGYFLTYRIIKKFNMKEIFEVPESGIHKI